MKIIFKLFIFLILSFDGFSQITFNKAFTFEFDASLATSLLETDTSYIISGVYSDILNDTTTLRGVYLAELDFEGNLMDYSLLVDSTGNNNYNQWRANLTLTNNGHFIQSGYHNLDGKLIPYLTKFNKNCEIDFITRCQSDFVNSEFEVDADFVVLPDSSMILFTACNRDDQMDLPNPSTEICLFKMNKDGDILWKKKIEENDKRQLVGSVSLNRKENIILFGSQDYSIIGDFTKSRIMIKEIDTSGVVQDEWYSIWGKNYWISFSGIPLGENGYILTCHKIFEWSQLNFLTDPIVLRLDSEYNELWKHALFNRTDTLFSSSLRNYDVIQTIDKENYVVIGNFHKGDLNNPNGDYSDNFGRIECFDDQGNLIWSRLYQYFLDEAYSEEHRFRDIIQTQDGGFLVCGLAHDRTNLEQDSQRSWLLKLDEHGCLIPGCHLPVSSEEAAGVGFTLKTFPNPTSDFINVYISLPDRSTTKLILSDLSGKIMKEISVKQNELTLIIDVHDLAAGMYVLRLEHEGEVLGTEKVSILR